ncbi:MAG TPA: hypothetical protein VHW01_02855, partial [Polyangiaceae bacterium]|nr:hypothetical protein [Polyangiaceae bacterium]
MALVVRGFLCAALLASSGHAHAEGAPQAAAQDSEQSPSAAPAPVRALHVYMRTEDEPLTFSARARTDTGTPTLCVAPCDAGLPPGDYQLKLNGVTVDDYVPLRVPGTLHGELHSRAGARAGAWLALNMGGILGGVFITVAALGGPSWAYIAGGGSLAAGGTLFVVSYRADRASVSFTPDE